MRPAEVYISDIHRLSLRIKCKTGHADWVVSYGLYYGVLGRAARLCGPPACELR
jgi:hypothetical protein